MKLVLLIGGLAIGVLTATARAGSVVTITDGKEFDGKLTVGSNSLHVEGVSSLDLPLPNLLEADFSETPFHLDYFSSLGDTSSDLPKSWKAQDIGSATMPGSVSYTSGTFTLNGAVWDPSDPNDLTENHNFLVGLPWIGDGQWTARIKSMDAARAGIMVCESLDPSSVMISAAASTAHSATMSARYRNQSTWSSNVPIDDLPVWLRLSRRGPSVDFELSEDGKNWTLMGMSTPKFTESIWVGFFINSHRDKVSQTAVIDQVTFSPASAPTPNRIVPTGVLLKSGTFLAGYFDPLDISGPSPVGKLIRNGNDFLISAVDVAAVVCHPVMRSQLTALESQGGVILKNNDFIAGDIQTIDGNGIGMTSIQLGLTQYSVEEINACAIRPVQPQDSRYEVRLKDGSNIRAESIVEANGQIQIHDISGLDIPVAPDEITNFRAGDIRAQSLVELAWKNATALSASETAQAQNAPTQCWTGNEGQQIMVVPYGAPVRILLTERFKTLAMHIAISPDSPPNSSAILRVMADGKEIARTRSLPVGEKPRFLEVRLNHPQTICLVADGTNTGARVLLIDPLLIR